MPQSVVNWGLFAGIEADAMASVRGAASHLSHDSDSDVVCTSAGPSAKSRHETANYDTIKCNFKRNPKYASRISRF